MFYTYLATSQDVCALDDQMQVRSVASGRVINGFLGNDWVDGWSFEGLPTVPAH